MGLTHTVSGDVAHFRTPSRVPIDSLKFHFLPKQASGTPTPANPIPIEGWTGLNGKRAGKNILDVDGTNYYSVIKKVNGKFVNTLTDTRDQVQIYYEGYNITGNQITLLGQFGVTGGITSPRVVSKAISVTSQYENMTHLCIKHNGKARDFRVYFPIKLPIGAELKCSVEVFSVDVTTVGGFSIGNIQLEVENSTEYEPYQGEQIPITFPSNGKNRYYYDENNIETGVTLSSGLIRSVYHTGVYGNGNNISVSATAIDPEVVSNNSINIGYIKNGIAYVLEIFINWQDGSVTNKTVIVPNGCELVLLAAIDSAWSIIRNLPRYNVQIEYANAPTAYEPYSSDNTFYGGYIDPVAGEISEIFSYVKIKDLSWVYNTSLGRFATSRFQNASRLRKVICDSYKTLSPTGSESEYQSSDSVIYAYGLVSQTGYFSIHVRDSRFDNVEDFISAMGEHYICYESVSPKILPISPQAMKAFLDHNNFWSDANDITEVSYEVTESKDIQAARKRFEAEEDGHHKLVRWNQVCKFGNFQDANDWLTTKDYGSLSVNNGVMTWTALQTPTQYYQTGFMQDKVYTQIPYNHKVLVMAQVRTSCSHANLQARLYGMVTSSGGAHTYSYNQYINANEWTALKGFVRDRPETPPSGFDSVNIRRFKVLLALNPSTVPYDGIIDAGATLEAKNFMAYDLTQMFGLGNEPSTVEEFERICALNGIDLTTYQPYDSGSDRWLIVP